ncbi:carboxypeptidase-like regulatory domain-containing protein [Nocardioides sp.]|uniref:carboxypeptidase-like regulatory domain-containing protein n=1 Tax=Nocardioides sp. TaxID=35761 RepID=UPI002B534CC2|nr:carboxypeptidase-like regulatory domain-containing protein [Nocardioides sp.]HXH79699.1 carboxypeptidase-like regulatory domain-containing protein [Nocardioides sp.]
MSPAQRAPALVLALLLAVPTLFFVQPATAAGTGTISGTVTLAGGSGKLWVTHGQIQVLNGGTWTWFDDLNGGVDPNGGTGHYETAALDPGTYRIEFHNRDYLTQVSGPVNVTADTTVDLDVTLDPGANIQGRFTVPAGGPAVSGSVQVMERSSSSGFWVEIDKAVAEPDGTYYLSGLPGGTYKVGFGDFTGYYAKEYYDNVATLDQARLLTVPPGGSLTSIDVLVSHEPLPVPPPPAPPLPPAPPAPVPTSVSVDRGPRVAGIMRVGQRVRATIGTVSPTSATVAYAWFQDGRRIKKATARQLRLTPAMVGHRVGVRVTVTAPGLDRWRSFSTAKTVRAARTPRVSA